MSVDGATNNGDAFTQTPQPTITPVPTTQENPTPTPTPTPTQSAFSQAAEYTVNANEINATLDKFELLLTTLVQATAINNGQLNSDIVKSFNNPASFKKFLQDQAHLKEKSGANIAYYSNGYLWSGLAEVIWSGEHDDLITAIYNRHHNKPITLNAETAEDQFDHFQAQLIYNLGSTTYVQSLINSQQGRTHLINFFNTKHDFYSEHLDGTLSTDYWRADLLAALASAGIHLANNPTFASNIQSQLASLNILVGRSSIETATDFAAGLLQSIATLETTITVRQSDYSSIAKQTNRAILITADNTPLRTAHSVSQAVSKYTGWVNDTAYGCNTLDQAKNLLAKLCLFALDENNFTHLALSSSKDAAYILAARNYILQNAETLYNRAHLVHNQATLLAFNKDLQAFVNNALAFDNNGHLVHDKSVLTKLGMNGWTDNSIHHLFSGLQSPIRSDFDQLVNLSNQLEQTLAYGDFKPSMLGLSTCAPANNEDKAQVELSQAKLTLTHALTQTRGQMWHALAARGAFYEAASGLLGDKAKVAMASNQIEILLKDLENVTTQEELSAFIKTKLMPQLMAGSQLYNGLYVTGASLEETLFSAIQFVASTLPFMATGGAGFVLNTGKLIKGVSSVASKTIRAKNVALLAPTIGRARTTSRLVAAAKAADVAASGTLIMDATHMATNQATGNNWTLEQLAINASGSAVSRAMTMGLLAMPAVGGKFPLGILKNYLSGTSSTLGRIAADMATEIPEGYIEATWSNSITYGGLLLPTLLTEGAQIALEATAGGGFMQTRGVIEVIGLQSLGLIPTQLTRLAPLFSKLKPPTRKQKGSTELEQKVQKGINYLIKTAEHLAITRSDFQLNDVLSAMGDMATTLATGTHPRVILITALTSLQVANAQQLQILAEAEAFHADFSENILANVPKKGDPYSYTKSYIGKLTPDEQTRVENAYIEKFADQVARATTGHSKDALLTKASEVKRRLPGPDKKNGDQSKPKIAPRLLIALEVAKELNIEPAIFAAALSQSEQRYLEVAKIALEDLHASDKHVRIKTPNDLADKSVDSSDAFAEFYVDYFLPAALAQENKFVKKLGLSTLTTFLGWRSWRLQLGPIRGQRRSSLKEAIEHVQSERARHHNAEAYLVHSLDAALAGKYEDYGNRLDMLTKLKERITDNMIQIGYYGKIAGAAGAFIALIPTATVSFGLTVPPLMMFTLGALSSLAVAGPVVARVIVNLKESVLETEGVDTLIPIFRELIGDAATVQESEAITRADDVVRQKRRQISRTFDVIRKETLGYANVNLGTDADQGKAEKAENKNGDEAMSVDQVLDTDVIDIKKLQDFDMPMGALLAHLLKISHDMHEYDYKARELRPALQASNAQISKWREAPTILNAISSITVALRIPDEVVNIFAGALSAFALDKLDTLKSAQDNKGAVNYGYYRRAAELLKEAFSRLEANDPTWLPPRDYGQLTDKQILLYRILMFNRLAADARADLAANLTGP